MKMSELFERESSSRQRAKADPPEFVSTVVCPNCGGVLDRMATEVPALFVHSGYGATLRTDVDSCVECRWTLRRSVQEIRP